MGLNPLPFWLYPDVGGMDHAPNSVSGVYVNRNHMAGFLEMAIPLLLILFITRQRSLETKLGLVVLVLFLLTTPSLAPAPTPLKRLTGDVMYDAGLLLGKVSEK